MAIGERYRLQREYDLFRINNKSPRISELEAYSNENGKIVINMRYSTIRSMLEHNNTLYQNYWSDFYSGRITDRDPEKVKLRMQVDAELFAHYCKDIYCGVLSHNGLGASFYGTYAVTLKTPMVKHRVSFLEENPFRVSFKNVKKLRRAVWENRAQLVVVKYGKNVIEKNKYPIDYLLRVVGKVRVKQSFIEAHLWGSFTSKAFDSVIAQISFGNRDPDLNNDIKRIDFLCRKNSIQFSISEE